jgi:hypothetical protein
MDLPALHFLDSSMAFLTQKSRRADAKTRHRGGGFESNLTTKIISRSSSACRNEQAQGSPRPIFDSGSGR